MAEINANEDHEWATSFTDGTVIENLSFAQVACMEEEGRAIGPTVEALKECVLFNAALADYHHNKKCPDEEFPDSVLVELCARCYVAGQYAGKIKRRQKRLDIFELTPENCEKVLHRAKMEELRVQRRKEMGFPKR